MPRQLQLLPKKGKLANMGDLATGKSNEEPVHLSALRLPREMKMHDLCRSTNRNQTRGCQ